MYHADKSIWHLAFYALGVYVCYSVYSIFQEALTSTNFALNSDDESTSTTIIIVEKFHWMTVMLFFQSIANVAIAILGLKFYGKPLIQHELKPYALIATTYLLSMFLSNQALKYIDYPTQVLAKSIKPAAILLSAVIVGRRFPLYRYIAVFTMCLGVLIFMREKVKGKISASLDPSQKFFGRILIILSLLFDSATALLQDKVVAKKALKSTDCARPSSFHLMFYINAFALFYIGSAMLLSGEAQEAMPFLITHPSSFWWLLCFSVASASGQVFIFLTIRHFGALVISLVTTSRKFSSMVVSVAMFGHSLSFTQCLAVPLVFGALLFDSWKMSQTNATK